MNEGARALLTQGVRDSTTITASVQRTCGGPLWDYMTKSLQRPDSEATAFCQARGIGGNSIPLLAVSLFSAVFTQKGEHDHWQQYIAERTLRKLF
jgi:hypothetical protein